MRVDTQISLCGRGAQVQDRLNRKQCLRLSLPIHGRLATGAGPMYSRYRMIEQLYAYQRVWKAERPSTKEVNQPVARSKLAAMPIWW